MLSQMIDVQISHGLGEEVKASLSVMRKCKSFTLYWKSLIKREK